MMNRGAALLALFVWSGVSIAGPFDSLQRETNIAHTPIISAPDKVKPGEAFDVMIAIGEKQHPSLTDHFIRYIALYAGDVEVARVDLTPTMSVPQVTLTVTLQTSTTLRALAAPNHSAPWVAEHPITVTESAD